MNKKANKIIAVDFDGTLCENKYPEIGEPNKEVITYLQNRRKKGDKLILWTCRVGEMLEKAVKWCVEQTLEFDAVNENLPEVVEEFGSDTRKIFANEYIDDRNIPLSSCREKSSMQSWAEREIEIACKHANPDRKPGKWTYDCACYKSALKAFNSLLEDGHSGLSMSMTKHILNRLIDGKLLTPIEDMNGVWADCSGELGDADTDVYQCIRMSSLFKYVSVNGSIKYRDVTRVCGVNVDNPNDSYYNGLIERVVSEMFPITMPYFPESKPYVVHSEEFLTDAKNGDFDTMGLLYVIKPDGKRVEINRYFRREDRELFFVEITRCEYEMRRKMHQERLENLEKDCHGCLGAASDDCDRCMEGAKNEL